MSMAQRYADYLERESDKLSDPIKASAMRNAGKMLLDLEAENSRLLVLMREAMNDFHGKSVLFSSAFTDHAERAPNAPLEGRGTVTPEQGA